ncbi:ribosomal protein S18 acetylase RimI-like enzyme [Paenibacillus phyllosphaerae]|uniref:Ribosomal protein S18 acetylase RimI-like enzyme n=1 Tax=Paenibacillus phyllosphaerae TaxID=274593 RepID=A0A7W5B562_9BACL|nr:GNAT family N-acetyltransferase [Paenibacillus phyllosphaerae]MBB3114604.1 ribosomal protein S18 acetylase RimI-like enzyme [Paenibacillus phyllosphaerae]
MVSYTIHKPDLSARIKVRQAVPSDTKAVQELLLQTARWLQSKGSTQWGALLSGQDGHNMAGAITRGEVFVFEAGEALAGTFILMQEPSQWDLDLWGDEASGCSSAIYLHRLAINREFSGGGLGEAMMRWAEEGVSFTGKDRIRLDCIASNATLNRFYSGLGYTFKGERDGFCLYEKETATA